MSHQSSDQPPMLEAGDIDAIRAARNLDPPTWTFYGFVDHGATVTVEHDITGPASIAVRTGMVKDQLPTLDAAIKEAQIAVAGAGTGKVVGVIVQLDHGHDINGQRHIIHRINGGKAWWE